MALIDLSMVVTTPKFHSKFRTHNNVQLGLEGGRTLIGALHLFLYLVD